MIDKATYFVYSFNNPALFFIADLINNQAFLVVAIGLLTALSEMKEKDLTKIGKRISKILFTILIAYILTEVLKNVFAVQRPCSSEIVSKITCPSDFGFPSGHVLIISYVMFAYIKRREFIVFWICTILVALTRIYLGVHTLVDVAGSIALAPLIFHFTNVAQNRSLRPMLGKETNRQMLHIALGAGFLLILLLMGRNALLFTLSMAFIIGILIINQLIIGRFLVLKKIVGMFERKDAKFIGDSTVWYVSGLLICSAFLQNPNEIAAAIIALGIGDSFSNIFGRMGRIKIPWNMMKTFEGMAAFFAGTLLSYFFIGPTAVVFSLAMAVVETIPQGIDDNFMIPIASAIFFHVIV